MLRKFVTTLFFIIAETVLVYAQQLYVQPVDDSGFRNDCNDISRPCTLRRALYVATDGDELVLKEGNYTSVSGWIADVNNSVTLTGGWDGIDRMPLNINPERYPSIIDGMNLTAGLRIEPQKDVTIRGLTFARCRSDENGSALYDFNAAALHLVNDVFIDNMVDSNDTYRNGGAVFITGGTLDINESNFTRNGVYAEKNSHGGAVYAFDTNGTIANTSFIQNSGWQGSAVGWNAPYGTTMSGTILNCVFRDNGKKIGRAVSGYGTVESGYINMMISGSLFEDNSVFNEGAACYLIASYKQKIVLKNNRFKKNGDAKSLNILKMQLVGQMEVYNNVFIDNSVRKSSDDSIVLLRGIDNSNRGTAMLDYNTFSENNTTYSVKLNNTSYVQMRNNIFSGTTSAVYVDSEAHIPIYYNNLDWNVTTRFSGSGSVDDEKNNLTGDPRFARDGWHLQAGSAAINSAECVMLTDEDIDRDKRPFGKSCDIGADEFIGSGVMPGIIMYMLN